MLEGALPPNWQREWLENELLPALDNNIQCGNSLIDSPDFDTYVTEKYGGLFPLDDDVRFRINRFDWTSRTRGFGRLLDSKAVKERGRAGFDCIIGNPPYIRVQELKKWAPEECEFYKWKYKSAAKGSYDIYVVFAEKCLSLLTPNGLLGFIMPHKFWQAKYGEGLRKIIADGRHLTEIVDFTHNTVFRDASIYTAIHVFSNAPNRSAEVAVARITELTDGPAQVGTAESGITVQGVELFPTPHPLGQDAWTLVPQTQANIMTSLRDATDIRLADIADRIAQGLRTSMNQVYVLTRLRGHSNRFLSEHLDREIELEPDLLLTFLCAEHMRRYDIQPTSQVVLVPYDTVGQRSSTLTAPETLRQNFPATWAYLKECEDVLRGREEGRMNTSEWYGYVYPKNLGVMASAKILVPDIIESPTFSLDDDGAFAFVSGYAITLQPEYSQHKHFVIGLLNSKLLGGFLKTVSTPLRGGWYRPFAQFMKQIPIRLPNTPDDKRLAGRITESVRAIMDAKRKLRAPAMSDRESGALRTEVEERERRIDEAVFALYRVDGLPE